MKQPQRRDSEAGFSLVSVLIFSAVVLTISTGTVQVLGQRIDALKILRMQQRMELLQQKVENTANSFGAMSSSAEKNTGTKLQKCFQSSVCDGIDLYEPYILYDGLGQRISGTFDFSGRACTENCPIEIKTEVKLVCDKGAPVCAQAVEMQTRFTISQINAELLKGRKFDPITGSASVATFVCPAGQYIIAVSDQGQIRCESPEASPNDETCPPESVAIGLDSKGFLQCMPIQDYCAKPIGLSAVLDTSGSMNSSGKLDAAKDVLSKFLGTMETAKDKGTFTTFNNGAKLQGTLTNNFGQLQSSVNSQKASGGTDMSSGIRTGAQSLTSFAAGPKIMIFVSDGFNNQGSVDPPVEAQNAKNNGVRIITIGFSKDADRSMLRKIASTPSDYFDAANASDLKKVFEQIETLTCRGSGKGYGKGP